MSHRTAATALLLVSLPYGLALPQIIPRVSEVTRVPKPLTLPYEPGYEPSSVTVVGTVVDATTDPTPLETIADAISDALPEDPLPTLDDVASILPFILPGLLPVETDLPPIDTPDVDPSDLPVLDPENGDGTFADDDLPDSNDLEVIDLPAPSEVPYGDDGLTVDPLDSILSDPIPDLPDFPELPDFPDFSDFPDEKTVPISTFNAVVQPLISAIQTLLNALPGNFAPPLPGIFIHPLLPTKTPDIFIDPILPTETPDIFIDPLLPTETFDSTAATATDAIDALLDSLLDPIPSIADSVATDLPFVKRQDPADAERSSIIAIIGPILDAIRDLIGQIPSIGPAVANAVSEVEDAVPYIADQVVDVPAADTQVPVPTFTLPALSLPTIPTDLPVDVPAIPELPSAEVPLPSLPADVPVLPVEVPDLTSSGIPAEVLNVPIPDIDGIDWSQYESPPFVEVPSPSSDDIPIPTDVLNVPVPDFDEFGVPIDAPLDGSDPPAAIPSLPLPTSPDLPGVDGSGVPVDAPVDAVSDLPNAPSVLPALLDWPFNDWEIPDTLAPDASGELPDLSDLPIPSSVLSVPVPDSSDLGVSLDVPTDIVVPTIPTDAVAGLVLPAPLPELTLVPDLPQPTGLFDVPVPEGFEDVGDLPAATDVAASLPLPTIDEPSIPTDILNIPVPDVDQFGVPLDLPTDSGADLPVPTNFLDVPVPEGFEDVGDLPAATDVAASLPLPTIDEPSIPTDILNIPVPDVDQFGVPLDLPTDSGADLPVPTNFLDVPVPEGFEDVGDLPAATDVAASLPLPTIDEPSISTDILNIPVPDVDQFGVPLDLPTDSGADLPFPTNFLDVPVPEGFEDLGEPFEQPASALPTDAVADFADLAIPDAVLNVPVPDLDNLDAPVDLSTEPVAALPTSLFDVPVPEGFEDLGDSLDGSAAALPTDAVPDVQSPAIPLDVLDVPVPNLDDLNGPVERSSILPAPAQPGILPAPVQPGILPAPVRPSILPAPVQPSILPALVRPSILPAPVRPSILPAPVRPSILPAPVQPSILPALVQPSILPAPVQPSILPAPALPKAAFGAGFPIQALPDIPLILPSAPTDVSPTLPSNVVPVIPVVAPPALPTAAASTPAPAVPAVPALPIVPTLQGIVPSGVATTPAVPVVAVLPAVPTLQGIAPKVPLATPRLPFQIRGQVHPLMERDMMAAQAAQIAPAKLPIGSDIALTLVKSLLTLVRALVDVLPVVGKTVPSLDASLPAAVATILPALPTVPVIPAVPEVASALPPVPDVGAAASTVTGAVSAVPGISEVLSTEGDAVPKVPLAFDSGIEKRRLPLARRVTEIQQGSASNWESFLGELDEFKQEELHGLIQDSAAAVTHNDMKNLASKLEADFKDFSDESKAQLLNGWAPGSVLTAVQERSMRNGKRQTGIPGAQSIGPDLDDAQKVDLSGILGPAGTLDPFDQLHASGSGKFADDLPEGYLAPSQAVSTFDQLDDSSVDRGLSPHLSSILGAAGTLDPNGMLGSQVGRPGSVADGAAEENPYADLNPSWDPAFQGGSKETLPGLEATLQAAKGNHVGGKAPRLPFAPQPGGSAAAAQERAAEQGRVLKWFNRFVRPSGRSDVDAKIVQ